VDLQSAGYGIVIVVSVNIGRPVVLVRHGRQYSTAINRQPAAGPLRLSQTGFVGDRVSDDRCHGGPHRAACVYPHDHYPYFARRLGRELGVPSFGENLTTQGWLETDACIGDVCRVGGATVQISSPRQPCSKLALKHDAPELVGWIRATGYSGFYLRVLEEGDVTAGDAIRLVERPHPEHSLARVQHALFAREPDRELLRRMAALPELSPSYGHSLHRRLNGDLIDGE